MQAIITPEQMRTIDASSAVPLNELIDRAGWAVRREALRLLGGGYGRRVLVIAGPGKNGEDGRVAAALLRREGVRCDVIGPDEIRSRSSAPRHPVDLIIDGCVGTGLSRDFRPPDLPGLARAVQLRGQAAVPVLAIDIPSGVDGLTGVVRGEAIRADRTITFGAHKPGLLLNEGPDLCGEIVVDTLGLDCSDTLTHLIEGADLSNGWPKRSRRAHKWDAAVLVVGGSPGMEGAASLAGEAAARAGAGLVSLASPGGRASGHREAISMDLPETGWVSPLIAGAERFGAIVFGPGLSPEAAGAPDVSELLSRPGGLVIDAGGIGAVVANTEVLRRRETPAVVTPHDGEFRRLTGRAPGEDRIQDVRRVAADLGAVVLLKGSPTVIADPSGNVRIVNAGDQRLATAGTGDVLSGVIGAGLAYGLDPLEAASLGAHLHGRAARATLRSTGFIASDLLHALADALADAIASHDPKAPRH